MAQKQEQRGTLVAEREETPSDVAAPLLSGPHGAAVQEPRRSDDARAPLSGRPLAWSIVLLTLAVFITDYVTTEDLHAGVLFNVCIALTLWSWRPRWVVMETAATVILRLLAHFTDPAVRLDLSPSVDMFNLTVGLLVQVLTGALIWRHVGVQQSLEARQAEVAHQAEVLSLALEDARRATRAAQDAADRERGAAEREREAADRERAARLGEVDARKRERRLFHDLERVKGLSVALHRAVLPDVPPSVAEGRLRLAARYAPAEREMQIGGDFYDLFALDGSGMRWGLVIGDVAGHGVDAAAQTALVTTTLRTCVFESEDGPALIMSRTARALEGQLSAFVSAVYAVFDAEEGTLTWANAGHEPPLLARADVTQPVLALSPTGALLGIGLTEFSQSCVAVETGDALVMVTDGLVEARTRDSVMLGWDGLAALCAARAAGLRDPESIADGLLDDVRAFAGERQISDDIALLVACVG